MKYQASFISWRFYLLITLVLLIVSGLIIRMVDLTVINRGFLQRQGNVRVLRTVSTPGFRGIITDRNGNPLAVSTNVYSVWINPKEFSATKQTVTALSQVVKLQPQFINKLLLQAKAKHKGFLYIRRGVSPSIANKVKQLDIPSVYTQEEYKRYYPEGEITSHLVGFTNVDDKGQEGIELVYNDWLTGIAGKKVVIKDRLGRSVADVQNMQSEKPGNDLVLSVDKRLQYLAYRELMNGIQKNVAESGTAIVLDAKTGEILAMVNLPSFNPNNRAVHDKSVFRNRAVTDSFEPGSTIKAFSIASILASGKFTPNSTIDTTPGWMRVDHHVVRDENNEGVINLAQVLQFSSNVGTTKMILSIPPNQLREFLHKVGFSEPTGIDFPGEQSGSIVNPPRWSDFTLATLSFGYGISVTPLQLAQAYMIFANDGIKIPVSLLKLETPPKGERVMDKAIAKQMMALLETVVTAKRATGELAKVPGYRVAGKTGTAVMAGNGGYRKHHFTSTFIGIAPASNPRFVVAVVIHDPQGKHYYASMVAAPIFKTIMEGALRVYDVPPDDTDFANKAKG